MGDDRRRVRKIAGLNDLCRTAMGLAGRLVQTDGINALTSADQSAIRQKVELFNAFTPDNDPHLERDFGSFEHHGEKIFWKIDCFEKNSNFTAGAETPENPATTERVLTIMLAEEY